MSKTKNFKNLIPTERKQKILDQIQENGSATVVELSSIFGVSAETIRRDLTELEKENYISKVYGGAYLGHAVGQDLSFSIRKTAFRKEKSIIAAAALRFVQTRDTVFLCPSTTSLALAQRFRDIKHLTVITNALFIADCISESPNARVICIGGELDPTRKTFNSCAALETLSTYHADKAFVSCTGVSLECGLTDSNENQARIRKRMLLNAKERILIADATKFGKITLTSIAPLSLIDHVICDQELSPEWMDYFQQHNIEFINASKV